LLVTSWQLAVSKHSTRNALSLILQVPSAGLTQTYGGPDNSVEATSVLSIVQDLILKGTPMSEIGILNRRKIEVRRCLLCCMLEFAQIL
jgi:hypothetical protein